MPAAAAIAAPPLRTTDSGQSWTARSLSAPITSTNLTSVSTIDGQEAWIGGTSVVLHTVDGGAHWTPTDSSGAVVAAAGPYAAWAVGPGSSIQKNADRPGRAALQLTAIGSGADVAGAKRSCRSPRHQNG